MAVVTVGGGRCADSGLAGGIAVCPPPGAGDAAFGGAGGVAGG